jgi:hypothetical protein
MVLSKLLTFDDIQRLPMLYSQERSIGPSFAYARFWCIDSGWTWYAMEAAALLSSDGTDGPMVALADVEDWTQVVEVLFFGLVHGFESEFGYFTLNEMQSLNEQRARPYIVRDARFKQRDIKHCRPCEFVPW